MSKLDAQRAMRAAKYDAAHAGAGSRPARSNAPGPDGAGLTAPSKAPSKARSKTAAKSRKPAAVVPDSDEASPELCGHRSMAGKACKRPLGHSETSHRYT
ncbi:MAG: hypothetical protein ACOH2F_07265 [Cellulomonas sp.]